MFSMYDSEGEKSDYILPKYIPYSDQYGIVTKTIRIKQDSMEQEDSHTYPEKHINNRKDLNPPNLFQQSLHAIIKYKHFSFDPNPIS